MDSGVDSPLCVFSSGWFRANEAKHREIKFGVTE